MAASLGCCNSAAMAQKSGKDQIKSAVKAGTSPKHSLREASPTEGTNRTSFWMATTTGRSEDTKDICEQLHVQAQGFSDLGQEMAHQRTHLTEFLEELRVLHERLEQELVQKVQQVADRCTREPEVNAWADAGLREAAASDGSPNGSPNGEQLASEGSGRGGAAASASPRSNRSVREKSNSPRAARVSEKSVVVDRPTDDGGSQAGSQASETSDERREREDKEAKRKAKKKKKKKTQDEGQMQGAVKEIQAVGRRLSLGMKGAVPPATANVAENTDAEKKEELVLAAPKPGGVQRRWTQEEMGEGGDARDNIGCLRSLVRSNTFKLFSILLIISNAGFIAFQTQYAADHIQQEISPAPIQACDTVFCILFVFELAARMGAERMQFFRTDEKYWNVFDVILVVLQVQDQIATFALLASGQMDSAMQQSGSGGSPTFLRFLRTLRVLRVLRVVRLFKYCPQLGVMLNEIVGSISAVIWLFLLLGIILFILGLVFMIATVDFIRDGDGESSTRSDLRGWFGSVPSSLLALFKCISGGLEWEKVGDSLMEISIVYGIVFVAFVGFALFGIVNVVVGVFVESAHATARRVELDERTAYIGDMRKQLYEMDQHGRGSITKAVFMSHMRDEEIKEFFRTSDIEECDANLVFDLLDEDFRGEVRIDEFTHGILRLVGGAKSTDLVMLHLEHRRLTKELHAFMRLSETRFGHLYKALNVKFNAVTYARTEKMAEVKNVISKM